MIRRCDGCGAWLAPTASGCSACGTDADDLSWVAASGAGTLVSWSVVHARQGGPVCVPAFVELGEGPWLATELRLESPEQLAELHAGRSVRARFVRPAEGASYPVFGLDRSERAGESAPEA